MKKKSKIEAVPGVSRLHALRELLENGEASTQEELCEELEKRGFEVTQSTISRTLKKLGAIKGTDESGRTVYRLPDEDSIPPPVQSTLNDMILEIVSNGSIIVIHTTAGSASLVARHLDHYRPGDLLGTIAGDDTIFVAPLSAAAIPATLKEIRETLQAE